MESKDKCYLFIYSLCPEQKVSCAGLGTRLVECLPGTHGRVAAAATSFFFFSVQPGRARERAAREWEARGAGRGEAQEPLQPRARLV